MSARTADPLTPAASAGARRALTDLLVIAPHPDDELLGAGAIIAAAAATAGDVRIVIATDGGRSDPAVDGRRQGRRRAGETREGLARLLGRVPPLLFLAEPDGALDATTIDLTADGAPGRFVAGFTGTVIVTDPSDDHPDHKAAFGLASRLVASGCGGTLRTMPIGRRVDRVFDDAGFDSIATGRFAQTKRRAIAAHRSQIDTASGFALQADVIDAFCAVEYLRTVHDRGDDAGDATAPAHFDRLFARSPDPWGYDDRPYERDRFARTIRALGGRRYSRGLELGCANGALTRELAPSCARLVAIDASAEAIAAADARIGALGNVTLDRRSMPDDLPPGPFDLVVASDCLYYLGLAGIVALMREIETRAMPGCRVLIANYLGETDTRITGEMASEIAIAHLPGWRRVHAERTRALRIDVLDRA